MKIEQAWQMVPDGVRYNLLPGYGVFDLISKFEKFRYKKTMMHNDPDYINMWGDIVLVAKEVVNE